ncbi:MAG: magnesium transporter CorA [Alphaproteobacteria bacterium]|nr:magnesium transporter CorA [Alphaproteobacteria bacterium]
MIPYRLAQTPRADIPGCLWFVRFGANGEAAPGTAEDFDTIGAPREGFLWLHMDLADVRSRPLLARIEALPEDARDSLCDPVDHQHLEYSEGIVSGALLDYERDLGGPTSRTDYVRFASGASFCISARRLPMDSVEQTRIAVDRGACLASPIDLFELLTHALIDGLARKAAELGAAFDRVEDRIIDQRGRLARPALSAARRDAVRLSRQISGLSTTVARLETIEEELGEQRDDDLREAAARLVQHAGALTQDVTSLQERARLLQDELNDLLSLETNDRLYVLTFTTMLLLPATFVTGYFGMNTKNLLFAEDENGTLYATILCLLASATALFLMRRWGLAGTPESEDKKPAARERRDRPADRSY